MSAQTWHYGLQVVGRVQRRLPAAGDPDFQLRGQPALDVACGTGRLLIPYLRAGLDVDGCDVYADMVARCRQKTEQEGLSPTLFVQPMHEVEAPRTYRTIYVCGSFGLGSTRERSSASRARCGRGSGATECSKRRRFTH